MNSRLLALDFGGTKLSAAVLERRNRYQGEERRSGGALEQAEDRWTWHAYERIFSPPGADARYSIQAMINLGRKLLDGRQPAAVGVSFGGPVDASTGTVRLSHHVPGWGNTPLARMLEEEFGAPAQVDNDANVAALGEHRFGGGRGFSSLMYITVSTGVGGGWILDNRPWRGADGMAGEIGHMVVDPQGPFCVCGKRGCVERLASGPYMAQTAREIILETSSNEPERGRLLLQFAGGDPNALTGEMISQAAGQGDELALQVLDKGAWALGVGIGNVANLVNPQRFILGGGVTKSGPLFWETVRRTARGTALPEVHFEVVPAELGDDAPLWGAAALAEDCLASL
jgi:glucokinase